MHNVYGLGTVLIDYYCKCEDSDLGRVNLPKEICTTVDQERLFSLLSEFNFTNLYAGGTTANIIREMQALGCNTMFTGVVKGQTSYSEEFIKCLTDVGVNADIIVKSGIGISIVLIFITPDGRRTMAYLEDNPVLLPEDINNDFWHNSDILLTDGNLCDGSATEDTLISLLHQSTNTAFCFPVEDIIVKNRQSILQCIDLSNIIFGSINDYVLLFMISNDLQSIGNYLFEQNFANDNKLSDKVFVVTNDEIGAIAVSKSGIVFSESEKVEKIIDNTGAGNFFAAAFLTKYMSGESLEQCLRFGHKIAAKNVQQHGTGVIKNE